MIERESEWERMKEISSISWYIYIYIYIYIVLSHKKMWYVTIAIEILTIIKEKKSIIERVRVKERQIYRAKVRVWSEEWGGVISWVLPSSGGRNYFSYPKDIRRKWNNCTNQFLIFGVYSIYIYIYLLIIIFLPFF